MWGWLDMQSDVFWIVLFACRSRLLQGAWAKANNRFIVPCRPMLNLLFSCANYKDEQHPWADDLWWFLSLVAQLWPFPFRFLTCWLYFSSRNSWLRTCFLVQTWTFTIRSWHFSDAQLRNCHCHLMRKMLDFSGHDGFGWHICNAKFARLGRNTLDSLLL